MSMSMSMSMMIEYGGGWGCDTTRITNRPRFASALGSWLLAPGSPLLSCKLLLVSPALLRYAHHLPPPTPPHRLTTHPPTLKPTQTPRIIHPKARKRPIPRQPLRTLALPALPAPTTLRVVPVPVSAPPFALRARRGASGHGDRGAVRRRGAHRRAGYGYGRGARLAAVRVRVRWGGGGRGRGWRGAGTHGR
ncbi:hypothetical protein K466DRAFT_64642 [Polyporus arcularius HHB13444]|uniref:Uncharacterized protein n=1 Tax=Polyporus arcularius HHB13444 TaxID=1314778 RepID=A0A5C3PFU7_9APHY|nr:hypothetical protein K466DRAFT_64642 [Polyporus arcularius HHB13444]